MSYQYLSDKVFESIFYNSADSMMIVKENHFVDCNQAFVELFGYETKKDLIELHPSHISPEFQPDGSSSFTLAEEMISITIEKGSHRFMWLHQKKMEKLLR